MNMDLVSYSSCWGLKHSNHRSTLTQLRHGEKLREKKKSANCHTSINPNIENSKKSAVQEWELHSAKNAPIAVDLNDSLLSSPCTARVKNACTGEQETRNGVLS